MEKISKKILAIIIGVLLIFLSIILIQKIENNSFATILLLLGIGITIYGITIKIKLHPKKVSSLSAFKKEPAREPLNADNEDD
jgi:uncharacterized membrane protein YczE